MAKEKILVIEDDQHILELIKVCLEQEDFLLTTAENGLDGLNLAEKQNFDLIILDIMLPEKNGWEVCRQYTGGKDCWVPILMLTAKTSESDKILGLEMGADDYMTKPFSPRELVARVRAILRRRQQEFRKTESQNNQSTYDKLIFKELEIDTLRYLVKIGQIDLVLTPKEFELLSFLAQNKGQVFSREQLLNQIWGYEYAESTRTVDEHIKNLRRKIAKESKLFKYIHTVWGIGYKFEVLE